MSASNESQRRDSSSGGRNRNRSRNRSRNRNRDGDRNRNQEGFQEGNRNRNRDRDRNRNRRPRAMKRDATVFEKILEFLTFGLWKPDLTVRDGSTSRTSMERRVSQDREDENTTPQTAERPRRERSQNGEGNRERDRDRSDRSDRGDRAPREKRPPEPAEVTTERLYVGNLDYETTEADLYDLFNGVGKVKDAEVVCHKYTQRSKGYAFVVMSTVDEAKRAVAVLNNKPFMGRELWVSGAKSTGPKDLDDSAPGEEESQPASVSTEEQPEATEEISGREAIA